MITSIGVTSADAQLELQSELLSGESLLWAGQPSRRVVFHRTDWMMIPFSFLWGGFALFWEYGVSGHFDQPHPTHHTSAMNFMSLWGIPFVLVGQYLIWGRFLYVAWRKARTFYGVTNKRVLVLGTTRNRRLSDGYLKNLTSVTLTTRSDGVGTIEFAPEPETDRSWNSFGGRRQVSLIKDIDLSRLAFFDVNHAKSIYQIIQIQRDRSRADN
ncbi:MAG: hypothetical protein WA700_01605 [Acidobacteriaceae bacterium]